MLRRTLSSPFYHYPIEIKIKEQQHKLAYKTLKRLDREHIIVGNTNCILMDVEYALLNKGLCPNQMVHSVNDFCDELEITINGIIYNLNIPLFPRHKKGSGITFSVLNNAIHKYIDAFATPDSVADFVMSVSLWIPEYFAIEERIKAEEQQKTIACDLSMDLLKKNICMKLEAKGYVNAISRVDDMARIRVALGGSSNLSFEVGLLDDFLDHITRIVDSLPVIDQENHSMLSFNNIFHCVVMMNYDDDLIGKLKRGGNNVISHEGRLWIPNMDIHTLNDLGNAADMKIFHKDDTLPKGAPMERLRTIDACLDKFIKGLPEAEREDFVQRLIDGVGYSGHYNRHRYKIPDDILNMEEK